MNALIAMCQFLAAFVFALVAGSVFGIWRGYDPSAFTEVAFVEMHQGAVRGLNVLLPAMGFASIILTLVLVVVRRKTQMFWLYLGALLFMVAAGVTTRFFNQPINAVIMGWAVEALPANWSELRARWWDWHLWRTGFSLSALTFLLAAIVLDRPIQT